MKLRGGTDVRRKRKAVLTKSDRRKTRSSTTLGRTAQWRLRLKETDPDTFMKNKKAHAEYMQIYRMRNVTKDKQNKIKEQNRIRASNFRKRKTEENGTVIKRYRKSKKYESKTKSLKEMSTEERKAYNAERTRRYRQNKSKVGSGSVNVNYEDFLDEQQNLSTSIDERQAPSTSTDERQAPSTSTDERQAPSTSTGELQVPSTSTGDLQVPSRTKKSSKLRTKVYRLKQMLPNDPKEFTEVLKRVIDSPKIRKHLNEIGIVNATATNKSSIDGELLNTVLDTDYGKSKIHRRQLAMTIAKCGLIEKYGSKKLAIRTRLTRKLLGHAKRNQLSTAKIPRRRKPLSLKVTLTLKDFFQSHWVSRCLPCKSNKTEDDDFEYVMELTLKEAYGLWKKLAHTFIGVEESTDDSECRNSDCVCKVSFSSFYRLKPKNVRSVDNSDFVTCLCEKCLNVHLMMDSINRKIHEHVKLNADLKNLPCYSLNSLLSKTLCPSENSWMIECVDRNCETCGVKKLKEKYDSLLAPFYDETVQYKSWERSETKVPTKGLSTDGKPITIMKSIQKDRFVTKVVLFSDLIELCTNALHDHAIHLFTGHWQQEQIRQLMKTIPQNQLLLVVDFSENISVTSRLQAQSSHYNKSCFTLFPAVAFYRDTNSNIVRHEINILSNDLSHNVEQAERYINAAINECLSHHKETFEKTFIASDRSSQQFSNGTMAFYTSTSNREHHYFGARHGKNVSDGAGANVKVFLTKNVLRSSATVNDLNDLYTILLEMPKPLNPNTRRTFIKIDIEGNEVVKGRKYQLKGIKSHHVIQGYSKSGVVNVRRFSCFCNECVKESYLNCRNINTVGSLKKISLNSQCFHLPEKEDSVQKNEILPENIGTDSVQNNEVIPENKDAGSVQDSEVTPDVASWVAIRYDSDWFPAEIVEIKGDLLKVNCLYQKNGTLFCLPTPRDKLWIQTSEILKTINVTQVSVGKFMLEAEEMEVLNSLDLE